MLARCFLIGLSLVAALYAGEAAKPKDTSHYRIHHD